MQSLKNTDSRRRFRTRPLLPWLIAAAVTFIVVAGVGLHRQRRAPAPRQVSYSTLLSDLSRQRVAALEIDPGREIRGRWRSTGRDSLFRVVYTSAAFDEVLRRAESVGVTVEFAERSRQSRIEIINLLVVLAGFVVLGYLVSRGLNGQSAGGGIGDEAESSTTFANVAGNEGTVAEL